MKIYKIISEIGVELIRLETLHDAQVLVARLEAEGPFTGEIVEEETEETNEE